MINSGRISFYKIGIGAAAAAVLLLYYFFDARDLSFPRCPFYLLTNVYCPGCGSQRALSALLHGHVAEALHNNFLLIIFLPLLAYATFKNLRTGQPAALFYKPWFVRVILVAVLLFWLLRNLPFYPFLLLAPVG
jgi:hypothetical protein